MFVAALAVFYYRFALGRSDLGHLRYASFFAYQGPTLSLLGALGDFVVVRPRLLDGLAVGLLCAVVLRGAATYTPVIKRLRARTAACCFAVHGGVFAPSGCVHGVRETRG